MNTRLLAAVVATLAISHSFGVTARGAEGPANLLAEQVEFFESRIRPALITHCYECHSEKSTEVQGGLMLDNRAAVEKGGDSGPVLKPGDWDASRLLTALRYQDASLQMPPNGKLPDEVIADFEHWIRTGAVDPREGPAPAPPESIQARSQRHWAFQPPHKNELPTVQNSAWPTTEIDYFILARLEEAGIEPAVRAAPRLLVRRLFYDLIGLPPTYAQAQAFVQQPTEEAYEQLVDQLLASEQFAERWARHWLDIARFGDTKGYVFTEDRNYPNAYKYRDWVIQALHQDMPFDQFLKYQIAADHIVKEEDRSQLAALGFLTLGRRFINNTHDIIDDRIDVVFRGTMGLTLGCARCHDHKYDPLPTRDYYGMYGVFLSSREQQDDDLPLRLVDKDQPENIGIFLRGSPGNRGEIAPRQFLSFFSGEPSQPFQRGSGRAELAEAIASPQNPLTSRVFVNRVWAHLYGEGLVRTTSDFGLRSDAPTHQEVLDHLAVTFMEDDAWSLKRLMRRLVMSSVYRQASDLRPTAVVRDPENLLLWRAKRRRLDFEAMRDSLLEVSGQLDRSAVGGTSVQIATTTPSNRRTLYAFIDRQNLPGLFRTFDFASPDLHSPKRPETIVPQQSLYLLNNNFVHTAAESLVQRLADQQDTERRIREIYKLVFAREPQPDELALGQSFLTAASSPQELLPSHSPWQFGYGDYSTGEDAVVRFQSLPHFTGTAWQGGAELPNAQLGWVILNSQGGHAGNDQQHAAIRRWVATEAGTLSISGKLEHLTDQGDGVRGRIVSSRAGLVGEWVAQNSNVPTKAEALSVEPGDTIDFITDCRANPNHDSFQWRVTIRATAAAAGKVVGDWNSERDFHGPLPQPLDVWGRYAQALLLTNEFMYLD